MLFLSSYEGLSFNLFPGFVISLVEFLVPRKCLFDPQNDERSLMSTLQL